MLNGKFYNFKRFNLFRIFLKVRSELEFGFLLFKENRERENLKILDTLSYSPSRERI